MAESAITFLLKNLTIWLQEERTLLGGLRGEVQIIHDKLQQMKAFLIVADAREETDPQLKEWVRLLREIAYDTEDVLESYMLRIAGHPSHGILGCIMKYYFSMKNLKAKHQMASEIKLIRSRAESASKTFEELKVKIPESDYGGVFDVPCHDGRGDALLLEEADVVGIERPKKQLLDWISMGDYTRKVISVVGMGGLGKTTLVKKVFDDSSVKENIDHHAWVTVSQIFDEKNILRDLITQLLEEVEQPLPSRFETMNVDGMKDFIKKFLQNKKYIIVLDDVWRTNVWDALQHVFPRNNTHGRGCIIITTRSDDVTEAACCNDGGHVYHLEPLPLQEAEKLLHKKAFSGDPCPDHLNEISMSILKRCEGLPLAIVVIGSLLSIKRNEIPELRKLIHNLTFGVEDDTLIKRMWKVLSLSYYSLPYFLKTCLLYLSIFPEDTLLEKATIIRLWTMEGFVESKFGKAMEEMAEEYLNTLCKRSLIQVAKTHKDGSPRSFRIHDIVREYIFSKAREQNLVAIREMTLEDRIRRLALDNNSISYGEKNNNLKYLRSLLSFGFKDLSRGSILCRILHGDCRILKILDLRGAPLDEIPNEVFKLYHLKYLSLRDTNVSLIPKLIGNLVKLEVLDLKRSKVVKLPVEILKLLRLQHLLVYTYISWEYDGDTWVAKPIQSFEAPCEIGQLSCLVKLCFIDASANIVKEIRRLTKLRRLGLVKLRKEHGKELCSSLTNLTHLSSLDITAATEEGEVIDLQHPMPPSSLQFLQRLYLRGRIEELPQWIPSLKELTHLRLIGSKIRDEDPLEYLQGLPNLQILDMFDGYDGEGLSFKSEGFPRLKKLQLKSMRGLRWVRVEKGSMPCLNMLLIADCKAMMDFPRGIEHLTNLDDVCFTGMQVEFWKKVIEERSSDKAEKILQRMLRRDDDMSREFAEQQLEKRGEAYKYHWKLAHVRKIVFLEWVDGKWKSTTV